MKKSVIIINVLVLLIIFMVIAGIYLHHKDQREISLLSNDLSNLKKKLSELQQNNPESSSPSTPPKTSLSLIYPKGGEKLCTNGIYTIKWAAQENMEFVDIYLESLYPSSYSAKAYYLVKNGLWANPKDRSEYGTFVWSVDSTIQESNKNPYNAVAAPIKTGDKFRISLSNNGVFSGENYVASEFFSLINCN